jgi:hypothetical protein
LCVEHQNGAEILRSRRPVEQDLLAQLRFLGADLGALPPVDDFPQRQVLELDIACEILSQRGAEITGLA